MIGQPRTINYELKTLGAIFRFGKKQGLCHDNPCENITYLKIKTGETPRFLTNDECRSLLENSIEKYRGVFLTFLLTGLRLGELINLQWGDIDFRRRILKVQRKHDWEPKAGEREVPLNDELVTLLRKRRSPKVEKSDYIFTHEDGRKLGAKLRNTLVSTARRAGIENLTKIHSLRHTFASHLVMKGVDLPTVMKLMGHSDIQTTMIYAHLAPDHLAGAVNKLDF
jgi:integrase